MVFGTRKRATAGRGNVFVDGFSQEEAFLMSIMGLLALARAIAYSMAGVVAMGYALIGYAVYAHVNRTWPVDDPRMLIPGVAFILMFPGALLLALTWACRRHFTRCEYWVLISMGMSGVLLFAGVFGSSFLVNW